MSENKYCIIGDLHGRVDSLDRIIEHSSDYHLVFLGDTIHHKPFFKRTRRTSPIRMLQRIQKMVSNGQASMILGNNENYILKNLILPKSQIKQKEVKYTLQCLKELKLEQRLSLLRWLDFLPLTLEFESFGKTYRCAHGYYKPSQAPEDRNLILAGPGYPWFKTDALSNHIEDNAEYFFGHYGYPYFRKNLKILDATNFEGIGVYYTDREEFLIYY